MFKIFFLICAPLLIFVLMEYENISLFVAAKTQNIRYYIGSDSSLKNYNEAILLIKSSQYNEAKSLLQLILNDKTLRNPADVYELYGDLVYETHGSTGDILVFYNRSLEYHDSPRVKKKLELLKSLSPKEQKQSEDTENTGSTLPLEDMTWVIMRESRRQELLLSGWVNQNIRDLSAGMIEPQDLITRTLDILATGSSIPKDW